MEAVYFIDSGLVSVMASTSVGVWQEAWLLGAGGFAGVPAILGSADSSYRRVVHTSGTAISMTLDELWVGMRESNALRELLHGYLLGTLFQVAQCSVCNSSHSVPQRLARWLLLALPTGEKKTIAVSQENLARMLGVRRATITECLGGLEKAGVLTNARVSITIEDREKLQASACHCHELIIRKRRRIELEYEARYPLVSAL